MRVIELNQPLAEKVYHNYISKISPQDAPKSVVFYLSDILKYRLDLLKENFPQNSFHAIAIKTCQHPDVLRFIVNQGYGLEAASLEEVKLALNAGADNDQIVFNSPVKTENEILHCHESLPGIIMNANSLGELKRYPQPFNGTIALRINPLVNNEAHSYLNVSTPQSKFGVPISRFSEILEACQQFEQITCIHMHIGSGIKNFQNNVEAVKKVKLLADEINKNRSTSNSDYSIDVINIGGGLDFDLDGKFTVANFVQQLNNIEGLFGNYRIITEYGKFLSRHSAFAISDIEYVTPGIEGHPDMAYIHLGADFFVRKVYSDIPLEFPLSVIAKDKDTPQKNYRIVGPLCFAGDVIFDRVELPYLVEKDKLFIYNVGANTYSMWSQHCSREKPEFIFI